MFFADRAHPIRSHLSKPIFHHNGQQGGISFLMVLMDSTSYDLYRIFDLPESNLPNSRFERVGFCRRISNSFAIISSPFPRSTLTTSPKSLHRVSHSSNRRLRRRLHRAVCVLFYSILWMHIRLSHAKNVNKISIQPNLQRCKMIGVVCKERAGNALPWHIPNRYFYPPGLLYYIKVGFILYSII